LRRVFKLVSDGFIKPIHPITTYSFANIPESFAFMRSGRHVGKIVIADEPEARVSVPVRPPAKNVSLQDQASYMIVGGLKGLCGSLAIYLAKRGARNIIALSRSGCSDDRSQKVIANCNSLGCGVQDIKADVTDLSDVRNAFRVAKYPVAGIIQGAMVLRVSELQRKRFHMTNA
jgi:hypothetical protein